MSTIKNILWIGYEVIRFNWQYLGGAEQNSFVKVTIHWDVGVVI